MKTIFLFLFFSVASLLPAQTNTFFPFERNGQWGIVDWQGKVSVPPAFERLSFFLQPQPALAISVATKGNGESGLIDQNGATILPFQQQELLFTGLEYNVQVGRNGKWGAFDALGKKMIVPVVYDTVMVLFGDSLHVFAKKKDRYHVYRTNGKLEKKESAETFRKRMMMRFVPPMILMDVDENEIKENLGKGYTLDKRVRMGSFIYFPYHNQQHLYGLLDFDGKPVLDCKYEQLLFEMHNYDDFILVQQHELWGIFQVEVTLNGIIYHPVLECRSMSVPQHVEAHFPGQYKGEHYYLVTVAGPDQAPVKAYFQVSGRKIFLPGS